MHSLIELKKHTGIVFQVCFLSNRNREDGHGLCVMLCVCVCVCVFGAVRKVLVRPSSAFPYMCYGLAFVLQAFIRTIFRYGCHRLRLDYKI